MHKLVSPGTVYKVVYTLQDNLRTLNLSVKLLKAAETPTCFDENSLNHTG